MVFYCKSWHKNGRLHLGCNVTQQVALWTVWFANAPAWCQSVNSATNLTPQEHSQPEILAPDGSAPSAPLGRLAKLGQSAPGLRSTRHKIAPPPSSNQGFIKPAGLIPITKISTLASWQPPLTRAATLLNSPKMTQASSTRWLGTVASTFVGVGHRPISPLTGATSKAELGGLALAETFGFSNLPPSLPAPPPLPPSGKSPIPPSGKPPLPPSNQPPPSQRLDPTDAPLPPLPPLTPQTPLPQPLTEAPCDPELGCLRIQELIPPAAGNLCDPELGCLRTQPLPPPVKATRSRTVFLWAGVSYTRNTNVFAGIDPVSDGFLQSGLILYGLPTIGRNTYLDFAIAGNVVRYSGESQINYNDLFVQAGILQRLSPNMLAGIGWSNQQLYIAGDDLPGIAQGFRFLNDHAVKVELRRQDRLMKNLSLFTFYRLQVVFSEPEERSRIINAFFAALTCDIQPNLQLSLDYNLALTSFTRQERTDFFNQVLLRFTYKVFNSTRFGLYGGYSFGNSSDPTINYGGFVFGVGLNTQIGLF